jgi:flagellar assembly factor FliW
MMMTEEVELVTVHSPRFGQIEYAPSDVMVFPWAIPGFDGMHQWLILSLESQPGYVWIQSLDDPAIALPAADPWMLFEGYDPKLPSYAFLGLEITDPEDFTLLCVVVVKPGAQEMTMNLMAPIVVNLRTNRARQVVLDGTTYSVAAAIPRKAVDPA